MKINNWELLYKIDGSIKWMARCSCGSEIAVYKSNVTSGKSKRCRSCQAKRQSDNTNFKTHGLSKKHSRLYNVWSGIKRRCYNSNQKSYIDYGAKGITMCNQWLNDFSVFHEWAMKNGYERGLEIDRVDSSGDYEPDNCRFITKAENISRSHSGKVHSVKRKNAMSETKLGWSHEFTMLVIDKISSGDYRAEELAKELSVDRHTLSKLMKRNGLKTNWRKGVFTRLEVGNIRADSMNMTINALSEKYNSNHETISCVINKRGTYGKEYYI